MSGTPTPALLHGRCVLVVEDEFLIQLDIQNILEGAGVRSIITAGHVAEAMAALDKSNQAEAPIDVAVLDLKLDKESALPVAIRLTQMCIPFVFLTGAPATAAEANQFRQVPVVGKPFDSAALLAALTQALAKPS